MVEFALTMDFLIPFIFVLAIVFGALEMAGVFKNKAVHFIIAIVIAFFASSYQPFLAVLSNYLPYILWFFVAVFFIGFLLKILGLRKGEGDIQTTMIIYAVILFILLAVGWTLADQVQLDLPIIGGTENVVVIITLVIIAIIFFLAFKAGRRLVDVEQLKKAEAAKGGK